MALDPLNIPEILKRFGVKPQKSLGQNFLADHNALLKIVRAAGLSHEDYVLEIGAGVGNLTRLLAQSASKVIAVELDRHLMPVLEQVLIRFNNVRLVEGDILSLPLEGLFSASGYVVVANIPYYITTALIRHLLESGVKPRRIVLTIQQEVAERVVNRDEKMSLLSLSVQVYGQARIASQIPAHCFYPKPKVDSCVLIIDVFDQPKLNDEGLCWLFKIAHAAFNQKRKMLRNSLKTIFEESALDDVLNRAGVDQTKRPEALSLEDWLRLAQAAMGE